MIEIIIFGKGYGESILVRINEKWIVVDSFLEPKSKTPIAVKYLSDNGYSIEDIIGIICTHWDNDHVVGISQIIEQHSGELALCMPIVQNDERFAEYVLFYSDDQEGSTSEFINILELAERKKTKLIHAISERNLFHIEINDPHICLKALSPSDQQYKTFLKSIIIPEKGQTKRHIPLEENKISVVTYLKTYADSILLGADMENSTEGWESICSNFIDDKCHIFKIPHHGSQNGHNEKVWKTMVEKPISIITRFNKKHLPTDDMIRCIAEESSAVYVVGPEPKKDRSTTNQAKKYGDYDAIQSISMLDYDYGYVKLSKSKDDDDWLIETFGAAKEYT